MLALRSIRIFAGKGCSWFEFLGYPGEGMDGLNSPNRHDLSLEENAAAPFLYENDKTSIDF